MTDDFDEGELCIETDEVLAEQFGIVDNNDFVMVADNGPTNIEVRVLCENMEKVVRAYLEKFPQWGQP